MAVDIWRDTANNKVYVKIGSETIEVPHIIAEAYRQDEARLLKELREEHVLAETLGRCYEDSKAENVKLRDQIRELWYLVNHRSGYGYAAALEHIEELGIEVDA